VREGRVERVDLRELDDGATRELVRARYRLADDDATRLAAYLQARSGGNPFYINEVLRTLEAERLLAATADGWRVGDLDRAPVPPLVRQVVEGRLDRLGEADRQLLELAAVIGEEAPLDLWRLVGGVDVDRVLEVAERAVDAHLLRPPTATTHVRFTHALVRDALYHGQPLSRRRARHRRVAEVLGGRSDAPAGVVATHLEQADDVRAIEWLVRAGEQALALYAADDAIAVLTRAQELNAPTLGMWDSG
jgi:predicted ATPase